MSLCPYCQADYNEEDCEHFVFVYDRTFPHATGDSRCPLSIQSHSFDAGALGVLVARRLGGDRLSREHVPLGRGHARGGAHS